GLQSLSQLGFKVSSSDQRVQIQPTSDAFSLAQAEIAQTAVSQFLEAIQEEQFRRQYFYQAPFSALQEVAGQMAARG
ncbi:MAG: hypothetical protein MJA27_26655, partial [Pseudanabaenales cyanobacterium]|nr:hypothetical protein [Pseudanabaenales cyanobacterium]